MCISKILFFKRLVILILGYFEGVNIQRMEICTQKEHR